MTSPTKESDVRELEVLLSLSGLPVAEHQMVELTEAYGHLKALVEQLRKPGRAVGDEGLATYKPGRDRL